MAEVRARRIRITFSHAPDLEIMARSVPLGTLLDVATSSVALLASLDLDERGVPRNPGALPAAPDLGLQAFLDAVESWNLEVGGRPVPITVEGCMSLPDPGLIPAAIETWRDAQLTVPAGSPLPQPSNGGAPSPGVSIPMVPLS